MPDLEKQIETARPYVRIPTLKRVRAGVYVHESGRLIVLNGPDEGPRGGEVYRWELASIDPNGRNSYIIDGSFPFNTLTSAASYLSAIR